MHLSAICVLASLMMLQTVNGNAIPIWEFMSHEEKMGRLFYVFVHLVEQYCAKSDIPDCSKVLTLYGMSNLVNEDENSLNLMDPYQRNARPIIWEKIMRGEFKMPTKTPVPTIKNKDEDSEANNEIYPHEHEVRVKAPINFVASTSSTTEKAVANSENVADNKNEARLPSKISTSLSPNWILIRGRRNALN